MEKLRRLVRGMIGSKSGAYRAAARAYSKAYVVLREGPGTARRIDRLRRGASGSVEPLPLSTLTHPILVRSGTEDVDTVLNNAIRNEWGAGFKPGYAPRTMIDGGAFIGDSATVFLSRFPELRVIALEPNEENLVLARPNLAAYGDRVELLEAALWYEDTELRFSGESIHGAIGDQGQLVPARSLTGLIDALPGGRLDILKLDIEGAEEALFTHQPERWLGRVDHILIELHSKAIAALILPILERNGFACRQHRSVWHCTATRAAA